MSRFRRERLWVVVAAGSQLLSTCLPAQNAANSPVAPRARAAKPPVPIIVPSVPSPKSPVDLFRDLLAMSPAERKNFLTNRPPAAQKMILAKVREYESLKPDQREVRLKVTELRW